MLPTEGRQDVVHLLVELVLGLKISLQLLHSRGEVLFILLQRLTLPHCTFQLLFHLLHKYAPSSVCCTTPPSSDAPLLPAVVPVPPA